MYPYLLFLLLLLYELDKALYIECVSVGGEGGLEVLDNFKLKTISGKPLVCGFIPVAGLYFLYVLDGVLFLEN